MPQGKAINACATGTAAFGPRLWRFAAMLEADIARLTVMHEVAAQYGTLRRLDEVMRSAWPAALRRFAATAEMPKQARSPG